MGTSAGSIQLDLEVEAKLEDGAQKEAEKIVKAIKTQLSSMKENMFDNLSKSVENALKAMNAAVLKQTEIAKKTMKSFVSDMQKMSAGMRFASPKIEVDRPTDFGEPTSEMVDVAQPRAPPGVPSAKIQTPKLKLDDQFNAEMTVQQIAELKNALTNLSTDLDLLGQKRKQLLQDSLRAEILKDEKAIGLLDIAIKKADMSISSMQDKASRTKIALAGLQRSLNQTAIKTATSKSAFVNLSATLQPLKDKLKNLRSSIAGVINKASSMLPTFNKTNSGLNRVKNSADRSRMSFGNLVKSFTIFSMVFPLVSRGIMALLASLGQSLMANQQFANSFAQIRSNLAVAFMPIYEAILPALNALMSALATVTSYIAAFFSFLAGKTYQQSLQAAKGLNTAKAAMGAYGSSAKKAAKDAKGALASFDEINVLNTPETSNDGSEGGGAPVLSPSEIDTSQMSVIEQLANGLKDILAQVWLPFQQAWASEGANTINSAKYALSEILGLLGAIGTSMLTVWTGGSGTRILTMILKIFQQIFKLIGSIARDLSNAWTSGGIGTRIMQGVANVIEDVLTLIYGVGESLNYVWGVVGIPLSNLFMGVISATVGVFEALSGEILNVWNNGGSYLFEQLLILGAKILEIAGYIYNEFVAPFVTWFIGMIYPAIGIVAQAVGGLLEGLVGLIDWLLNDGKPILDTFIVIISSLATAFGIVKIATLLYNGIMTASSIVMGIVSTAGTVLGGVLSFICSPIGLVIAAIAAIIAIGYVLVNHWDTVCEVANTVWSVIQSVFESFDTFLTNVFTSDWSKAFGAMGDILNGLFASIQDIWEGIKKVFGGIIDFVTGVFTGNWSKAWQGVVDIFGGIFSILGGLLKAPINAVLGLINGVIGGLNSISVDIPDWVPFVGGSHFGVNIPKMQYLAKGGIVNGATQAVIGEAGAEAVVPLENNLGWLNKMASMISAKLPMSQPTLGFAGETDIQQSRVVVDKDNNDVYLQEILYELQQIKAEINDDKDTQNITIVASGDIAQFVRTLRFELQKEDKRIGSNLVLGGG